MGDVERLLQHRAYIW